jgi:hypothetical protein
VCSQLERMDWVIFSHSIFQSNLWVSFGSIDK